MPAVPWSAGAVQASVTRLRGTVPRRLLVVAPVPPTRCTRQARRPTAAVRDPGAVRAVRGRLPLSPFLLALILALATIAIAYEIYHARLGTGLFAIHDDEDVAEVMGVPTFRYKIVALGVSCALAASREASTRCSSPT